MEANDIAIADINEFLNHLEDAYEGKDPIVSEFSCVKNIEQGFIYL